MSHSRVLEKCQEAARPNGLRNAEYHLADASAAIIPSVLVIDQPDGTDRQLDWTLEMYMQVS